MRCSIWISGTYHNIFDIKQALDEVGFKIVNIIIWKKLDPPPLIYKNKCRFSYEFIIWADKGHSHIFNYKEMFNINNDELEDVWLLPAVSMRKNMVIIQHKNQSVYLKELLKHQQLKDN